MKSRLEGLKLSILNLALVCVFAAGFAGCAHHSKNNALNEKLGQDQTAKTPEEMRNETRQAIESSEHLSETQKTKLLELKKQTLAELQTLSQSSLNLKHALVRDLVANKYSSSEAKEIRRRIKQTETKRLEVFFNALERGHQIVGRNNPDRERLLNEFVMPERGSPLR